MQQYKTFARAYIKSMRLYYAFITGIAGWVGVSFYHWLMPGHVDNTRSFYILVMLFLSWGINQIYNDFLGLPEDRINAPNRPMVTGELNARASLWLSSVLLVGVLFVSYQLSPWSLIPVIVGVLLNILYEYAKAWSLIGNMVFGMSISMCSLYGYLAAGPLPDPVFTPTRVCALVLVALLNGLMTYFTYFKDYYGDMSAGKRTFIVKHGLKVARKVGIVGAFLPTVTYLIFLSLGWMTAKDVLFKQQFIYCGLMTLFLQIWTAVLYYRSPVGAPTYFSLVTNIRACVAGMVTLIAIYNGPLALYLFSASYIFIGFLFDLYKDAKS